MWTIISEIELNGGPKNRNGSHATAHGLFRGMDNKLAPIIFLKLSIAHCASL